MIAGLANAERESVLVLTLQGRDGRRHDIPAVVDTGFNGFLTLPSALLAALGSPQIGIGRALLANGAEELFTLYEALLIWDGQPRAVEADAAETTALIGMSLLEEYMLTVQVTPGGAVAVQAIA